MNVTYRCKRSLAVLSVASIVMGLGFVAILFLALQEESPPSASPYANILLILICAGPIVLLIGGGLYCLLVAARHRLTVRGDEVESVEAFSTKYVDLTQVTQACWRAHGQGGGRLALKDPLFKLTLDFSAYSTDQARQLIKFFRCRLPESLQTGWDKYWQRHWRLFDEPDPAHREQFAAETRALRWRIGAWCLLGFGFGVPAVIAMHYWAGSWDAIRKLPVLLLVLSILFVPVFLVNADRGRITERFPRPKTNALFIAGCWTTVLTITLFFILGILHVPGGQTVVLAASILTLFLLMGGAFLEDKRIRPTNAEAAKAAEEEYIRPRQSEKL
jgi:hypothetical protein